MPEIFTGNFKTNFKRNALINDVFSDISRYTISTGENIIYKQMWVKINTLPLGTKKKKEKEIDVPGKNAGLNTRTEQCKMHIDIRRTIMYKCSDGPKTVKHHQWSSGESSCARQCGFDWCVFILLLLFFFPRYTLTCIHCVRYFINCITICSLSLCISHCRAEARAICVSTPRKRGVGLRLVYSTGRLYTGKCLQRYMH